MLLATGPSFEFIRFLQVLGWIILPVSLIALLVTIILHRRKKRLGIVDSDEAEERLIQASPEQLGYTRGDGEYVFFDHSPLIGEYKQRLSYNHARFTALRHDFDKLHEKYKDLASFTATKFIHDKKNFMENTYEQMPQPMQEDIASVAAAYKTEKEELVSQVNRMMQSLKTLETENRALQDQVDIRTASDDEKAMMLNRWITENTTLREKVAEQQCLQEVLDEKKSQIEFLQNQLENRVRNNYQSEQQRVKVAAELEEERVEHVKTLQSVNAMKTELLRQQEEADKLQVILCGKEEQLLEKQQQLSVKQDHISWLENILQETKQQNELLNASSMDDKTIIDALKEQCSKEESRVQYLEQKLSGNKQMMQRLHKELSLFMDEKEGQPPVITLHPDYGNRDNGELAVQ